MAVSASTGGLAKQAARARVRTAEEKAQKVLEEGYAHLKEVTKRHVKWNGESFEVALAKMYKSLEQKIKKTITNRWKI